MFVLLGEPLIEIFMFTLKSLFISSDKRYTFNFMHRSSGLGRVKTHFFDKLKESKTTVNIILGTLPSSYI